MWIIKRKAMGGGGSSLFMACLGCAPMVFLGCKVYTAAARLLYLCFSLAGLGGFEAKETQTPVKPIPLAYPKHTLNTAWEI